MTNKESQEKTTATNNQQRDLAETLIKQYQKGDIGLEKFKESLEAIKEGNIEESVFQLDSQQEKLNSIFNRFNDSDMGVKDLINNLNVASKYSAKSFIADSKKLTTNDLINEYKNESESIVLNDYKLRKTSSNPNYSASEIPLTFNLGTVVVILAPTNQGKTMTAINFYCKILLSKRAVFISVEESQKDVLIKIATCYGNHLNKSKDLDNLFTVKDFKQGLKNGNPEHINIMEGLLGKGTFLSQSELSKKFKTNFNSKIAIETCKELIELGEKIIVIDYIQDIEIADSKKGGAYNYELKQLINDINDLASANDVLIVVCAQTNSSVTAPFYTEKEVADCIDIARKAAKVITVWDCATPSSLANGKPFVDNRLYSYRSGREGHDYRDMSFLSIVKARDESRFHSEAFRAYKSSYYLSSKNTYPHTRDDGVVAEMREYLPPKKQTESTNKSPANDIEAEPAKKINLREKFRGSKNAKH